MKILSKKKYEKLQECLTELQMDYADAKDQMKIYDEQVNYLQNKLNTTLNDLEKVSLDLEDKNKEIKRLKTLLTKNGIIYKKEVKNGN